MGITAKSAVSTKPTKNFPAEAMPRIAAALAGAGNGGHENAVSSMIFTPKIQAKRYGQSSGRRDRWENI